MRADAGQQLASPRDAVKAVAWRLEQHEPADPHRPRRCSPFSRACGRERHLDPHQTPSAHDTR
jgi:hypothetical protein